jgi:hypothetical protein
MKLGGYTFVQPHLTLYVWHFLGANLGKFAPLAPVIPSSKHAPGLLDDSASHLSCPNRFFDMFFVSFYMQRKHLGCHLCRPTLAEGTSNMVQTLRLVGLLPSMVRSSGNVVWSLRGRHTPFTSRCSGSRSFSYQLHRQRQVCTSLSYVLKVTWTQFSFVIGC